ncbi:MAG: hypothetical protein MZU84_03145 [Sphingobacterium sp.]|nr:hypothetical protein [Sphingobacterium sp.]
MVELVGRGMGQVSLRGGRFGAIEEDFDLVAVGGGGLQGEAQGGGAGRSVGDLAVVGAVDDRTGGQRFRGGGDPGAGHVVRADGDQGAGGGGGLGVADRLLVLVGVLDLERHGGRAALEFDAPEWGERLAGGEGQTAFGESTHVDVLRLGGAAVKAGDVRLMLIGV